MSSANSWRQSFFQYETSREPIIEEKNVTSVVNTTSTPVYEQTTVTPQNVTVDYRLVR